MNFLAYLFAFLLASVLTGHTVDIIHVGPGTTTTGNQKVMKAYISETHQK